MMTTATIEMATASRPLRIAKRAAIGTVALAATLAAAFFGWGTLARHSIAMAHPPPGRLIDVGGYRLHLNCLGGGSGPTVILEAGNADFSVVWAKVQPALAASVRVCAYDRAGLGWSERGTAPRTLDAMTDELRRLLDAAGIDSKLLLVGHSFGGIVARSFAAAHPDRIAGMILLDGAHERQLEASPSMRSSIEAGVAQFQSLVPLASLGLLAMMPHTIPNREFPEAAYEDYASVLATTGYFATAAEETAMLPANLEAMAAKPRGLGELPLTVLSRGRVDAPPGATTADPGTLKKAWGDLQAELAGLSANSRHVEVDDSGHYLHLDRPDLVVKEVQRLLNP